MQQEVTDNLSMNREQYSRMATGKSDPTMRVLQIIATVLDYYVVKFFEAHRNDTEINTVNEPLWQKERFLEGLDELQKSTCNIIDTAIAKRHLKESLRNAMSLTY